MAMRGPGTTASPVGQSTWRGASAPTLLWALANAAHAATYRVPLSALPPKLGVRGRFARRNQQSTWQCASLVDQLADPRLTQRRARGGFPCVHRGQSPATTATSTRLQRTVASSAVSEERCPGSTPSRNCQSGKREGPLPAGATTSNPPHAKQVPARRGRLDARNGTSTASPSRRHHAAKIGCSFTTSTPSLHLSRSSTWPACVSEHTNITRTGTFILNTYGSLNVSNKLDVNVAPLVAGPSRNDCLAPK